MKKPSSLMNTQPERVFSTKEQEQKRLLYERVSVRRRRFIDRIGYDVWDPFEPPKEPMDLRTDVTKRTVQELVREFLRSMAQEFHGGEYARGATECAQGIIARQEKYQGILDFCVWYHALLIKEKSPK